MSFDYERDYEKAQERAAKVPVGASMQNFATGATRSADEHKHDFEGFLSFTALEHYGDYMTRHRYQRDGTVRSSENWKKGIPVHKYVKSLVRHVFDLARAYQGQTVTDKDSGTSMTIPDILAAIIFNAQGMLHEMLKRNGKNTYIVCDATREAIKEGREFSFYDCYGKGKVGAALEGALTGTQGQANNPARNTGPYVGGGLYGR